VADGHTAPRIRLTVTVIQPLLELDELYYQLLDLSRDREGERREDRDSAELEQEGDDLAILDPLQL